MMLNVRLNLKRVLVAVYLVVSCQPSSASTEVERVEKSFNFMNSAWPMPAQGVARCPGTAKQWQTEAKRMVSFAPLDKTKVSEIGSLRTGIIKNALISYNYARLYLLNRRDETPIYDYWIGIASQASAIVGHKIRAVYYRTKFGTIPDGLRHVLDRDAGVGGAASLMFIVPAVGNSLAAGNQAVYHDIYWQFLAARTCGVEAMVDIVRNEMKTASKKEIAYWKQLEKAWVPIAVGIITAPSDSRDLMVLGTRELIIAEQLMVLQPVMYDRLDAKVVNQIGPFNPLAVATLPSNGQQLETFPAFAKRKGINANLSNGKNRVSWMFDFTAYQMRDLDQLAAKKTSERAYRPVFREAALIVSDYLPSN